MANANETPERFEAGTYHMQKGAYAPEDGPITGRYEVRGVYEGMIASVIRVDKDAIITEWHDPMDRMNRDVLTLIGKARELLAAE